MINENYILGVESGKDESQVIIVARRIGAVRLENVHTIQGEDAKLMYQLLAGKKVNTIDKQAVIIKNYGKAYCPTCEGDVHGFGKINHCMHCGQALDWEQITVKKKEKK